MNVEEFRSKVNIKSKLYIEGKEYSIEELVKFRFDDGSYYIKAYLNNGWVFADDEENNMFLLVRPMHTPFQQPFPKKLEFENKQFNFLYCAHATAEETWGNNNIFPKGNSERFWDYVAEDGSYLSIGIDDQTKEKVDFYGKIIKPKQLEIED